MFAINGETFSHQTQREHIDIGESRRATGFLEIPLDTGIFMQHFGDNGWSLVQGFFDIVHEGISLSSYELNSHKTRKVALMDEPFLVHRVSHNGLT